MRSVWFIRHGQSESNSGLPLVTEAGVALTPLGFAQADRVAAAFPEAPSLIVTSPYIRTQQTAQPTLERFKNTPSENWPIQEFTHLASSRCIGTTITQRRPLIAEYWQRSDPHYCDGIDAETFADVIARVQWLVERLKSGSEPFTAIFTHGLFLRLLLWTMLSPAAPLDSATMSHCYAFSTSFDLPNCAIIKAHITMSNDLYFSPVISSHLPEALLSY